jgi:hypothetical protein
LAKVSNIGPGAYSVEQSLALKPNALGRVANGSFSKASRDTHFAQYNSLNSANYTKTLA